jgi:hypothetical protein
MLIWFTNYNFEVKGGSNANANLTLDHPYFTDPVEVPKWDDKWSTGYLTDSSPEAPYIGNDVIIGKINGLEL